VDLHRLAIFVKVYEIKSLSRSAEAIFLTQPTISGHLKSLEEELGVRLFDRLGRGVEPTQAADVLYDHACRLLAMRDEAIAAVGAVSGRVIGRLSVGGSTIPGHYLLPGYLAQIHRLYPVLDLSLTVADTLSIGQKVEAGEIEIGVTGARLESNRLEQTPCCQDEMVLVVPAGHSLAGAGRVEAKALKGEAFLLREAGSGTRMVTLKALTQLGLDLADLDIAAELGSTEAVRQALLSGLGLSILSRIAVEEDIKSGRLVQVELDGLNIQRHFFIIWRAGRTLSPGGRKLVELIAGENKNGGQ